MSRLRLLVAAVVVLSACSGSAASEVDEFVERVEAAVWGPCGDDVEASVEVECAVVEVPLDYAAPDGERLGIALVRVPARAANPVGSVLVNPGGPGGSGVNFVATGGADLAYRLGLDEYHLVGFDPRGVERSGGLRCLDDADVERYAYPDDTPDTPEEEAFLREAEEAFASACLAVYGDELRHYGTANAARDMDVIRAALGEERLTFVGMSYGTYLGGVYATLFPDRVRAMVLDAAYDPGGDTTEQQYLTQIEGFERAFDSFVEWCARETVCALHGRDAGAVWDELEERLDESPAPGADGRLATDEVLDTATVSALYSESGWAVLASAMADALDGDGTDLWWLADEYDGRREDGTYDTSEQARRVITCASGLARRAPDDPAALLAELRRVSPRFTRRISIDDLTKPSGCATYLPEPEDAIDVSYEGDGVVLVVGGRNDPATPLRWTYELHEKLGPNAGLVLYTGEGHVQVTNSWCVSAVARETLVELQVPAEAVTCEPDEPVERPDFLTAALDGIDDPTATDVAALRRAFGLLDTDGYSEFRVADAEPEAVFTRFAAALSAVGLERSGEPSADEDGSIIVRFVNEQGSVALFVLPTSILSTLEREYVGSSGGTLVVLAYFPWRS